MYGDWGIMSIQYSDMVIIERIKPIVVTTYVCCLKKNLCCFSHSAHWLPTRKKLLYMANPARGLLNKEKRKRKKVWQRRRPPARATRLEKIIKIKITRRIRMSRRYAGRHYAGGLGPSRVRTRIPTTRWLSQRV